MAAMRVLNDLNVFRTFFSISEWSSRGRYKGLRPETRQVWKDLRLCPTESAGRQASRPAKMPSQVALVGEPCR